MAKIESGFRPAFSKMAPQAKKTRSELAARFCTTDGAITQIAYRGELPVTAVPGKRRACWLVADIRQWLNEIAKTQLLAAGPDPLSQTSNKSRPRLATDRSA